MARARTRARFGPRATDERARARVEQAPVEGGRGCFFKHVGDPKKIECNLPIGPNATLCSNGARCLYKHLNQEVYDMALASKADKAKAAEEKAAESAKKAFSGNGGAPPGGGPSTMMDTDAELCAETEDAI